MPETKASTPVIVQPVNDWLIWTKHRDYGPWVLVCMADAPEDQERFARDYDSFCAAVGLPPVLFEADFAGGVA